MLLPRVRAEIGPSPILTVTQVTSPGVKAAPWSAQPRYSHSGPRRRCAPLSAYAIRLCHRLCYVARLYLPTLSVYAICLCYRLCCLPMLSPMLSGHVFCLHYLPTLSAYAICLRYLPTLSAYTICLRACSTARGTDTGYQEQLATMKNAEKALQDAKQVRNPPNNAKSDTHSL
eukprot:3940651-Rhodomonas_salina.6